MDNLTHTLVGAALGRAGLARRAPMGMAALMIGANIPDLDVLGLLFGQNLGFRRGITHGIPALLLWPFLLTGLLLAWHRWREDRQGTRPEPKPRQLVVLSLIAVVSHPLLDWLNSYGMRWLMPVRGTWWYGDTWFIVDPWVIGVLGIGLWLSRAKTDGAPRPRPAQAALGVAALYAIGMGLGSVVGKHQVSEELVALGFDQPRAIMVTPVANNPLVRMVVVDAGAEYHLGSIRAGGSLRLRPDGVLASGMLAIDRATVEADSRGRQFLGWSRFPFARVHHEGDTTVTVLDDARYSDGSRGSFARTEVRSPSRR